jgi:ABC-2 type transport system permease protein
MKRAAGGRKTARQRASGDSKTPEFDAHSVSGKSLVIVESPAKAKTIGKYLGPDYRVRATIGHVRDLPEKGLGIDIERGFIDRLIAAPISRPVVVTGRLAANAALGVFIGGWFLAVGLIFDASIEGGAIGVVQVTVLLALAALAFGSLGAALALRSGNAGLVQGTFPLVFVVLFLSTAFFPRDLMQEPAATVAAWNPLSLIAHGLREPVIEGASLASFGEGLAGVAIVGVVSATLAAYALRHRLRAG